MSRRYYRGWRRYVPVAARRRQSEKLVAGMKKDGKELAPIEITGRKIAKTFWGAAWCENLESYSDYSNRLPRGRTYARNGSVIDLRIEAGRVAALVSGRELYDVAIEIEPLATKQWTAIKGRCAGQINSLIELLQGSISEGVMEIVSKKGEGLFPSPADISLKCSCPDWATMCKHVAASLYGVGARLDHDPALLFTLRGVDPTEMVEAAIDQPVSGRKSRRARVLETDELSSVFGIDLDPGQAPAGPGKRRRKPRKAPARKTAASKKRSTAKPSATPAARSGIPVRPKAARLTPEALQRLYRRAEEFVAASPVFRDRQMSVQLARGRLYFRGGASDLVARVTPLGPRSMLLESPRKSAWTEHRRGLLATVLKDLERLMGD